MASTQQLRRRITSVKSTKQITKAMEMVSASKLRRAQSAAQASKDFALFGSQLLARIRQLTNVDAHPLFKRQKIEKRLMILVASDGTLAGAYNYNVFKHFTNELQADRTAKIEHDVIAVGKQATQFCAKLKGVNLVGAYHDFIASPTPEDIRPILTSILDGFKEKTYGAVDVIYTNFVSTVNQKAATFRLLPAAFADVEVPTRLQDAVFEPSPRAVLQETTERLIEVQMMQRMLESAASEHASRMIAMKNATDNANDIVDDLTLSLNTARQAAITQELAEITGGAEALA